MKARALWRPWMLREYSIAPRDMRAYTTRELEALMSDFKALQEAARGE